MFCGKIHGEGKLWRSIRAGRGEFESSYISEPFYKIKGSNINLRQDTRLQFLSRKLVHRRVVGRAELNDFEPFELEPLALLAKEFIILSFFFFESFT